MNLLIGRGDQRKARLANFEAEKVHRGFKGNGICCDAHHVENGHQIEVDLARALDITGLEERNHLGHLGANDVERDCDHSHCTDRQPRQSVGIIAGVNLETLSRFGYQPCRTLSIAARVLYAGVVL